jgi:hypothetical protein
MKDLGETYFWIYVLCFDQLHRDTDDVRRLLACVAVSFWEVFIGGACLLWVDHIVSLQSMLKSINSMQAFVGAVGLVLFNLWVYIGDNRGMKRVLAFRALSESERRKARWWGHTFFVVSYLLSVVSIFVLRG